jgi:hypothetical protein
VNSEFVFVGYLVQERYVKNWWKREGKRLASLENTVHPDFEKPQWQTIEGVLNPTEFLLTPPDISHFPEEEFPVRSVMNMPFVSNEAKTGSNASDMNSLMRPFIDYLF